MNLRTAAYAVFAISLSGTVVTAGDASANDALSALAHTRKTLEQARTIIDSEKNHNQKLSQLHILLRSFLDTDTMGRIALDKHWRTFNAAQQKEFLELFRELFQRTYVQKLLLFDRPDFDYVGEEAASDHTRVDTLIVTPKDEFAVTYKFRQIEGGWTAFDIQIEELSLTTNFRRQLDRLLTASSIENVLGRMRRKYGKAIADDAIRDDAIRDDAITEDD